jgi:hypothetical protein
MPDAGCVFFLVFLLAGFVANLNPCCLQCVKFVLLRRALREDIFPVGVFAAIPMKLVNVPS